MTVEGDVVLWEIRSACPSPLPLFPRVTQPSGDFEAEHKPQAANANANANANAEKKKCTEQLPML